MFDELYFNSYEKALAKAIEIISLYNIQSIYIGQKRTSHKWYLKYRIFSKEFLKNT